MYYVGRWQILVYTLCKAIQCTGMFYWQNSNNLLAEEHYGFRTIHSTEYTVCIDLSKAFDTLSFDILLRKLNSYGIAGNEFKLLASYLKNRKQYVTFNNHETNVTDVTNGVPQESIIGLLLFSNDLKNVSDKLTFIMYADDTTIYFNWRILLVICEKPKSMPN